MLVRIAQAKVFDDVVANALRGGGSERRGGAVRKKLAQAAKLPIFGAEVVSPFGDAMGFVDGKEGDRHAAEPGGSSVEGDALWREIEKAGVAFAGAAKGDAARVAGKGGVEKTGGERPSVKWVGVGR